MRLISIYDVARDVTVLVESKDGSLTELKRAVGERCIPCVDVLTVVSLRDPILLINHWELKGKRIPEKCWKNPFKSIQVVSRDVKFSRSFKVYVDGKNINGKKGVKMKCTHTVDELKSKVTTSPWKFQLHMDTQTLKDHCTLLYYKIGQGTNITIHEVPESRMQIYLQFEVGKEQPRMVERDWTVKRLKSAISNWNGIPIRQQALMFRGRVLSDGIRLTDYNGIKCIIQVSRPGVEWHPIMEPLELDHFGWLLARVVKQLDDEFVWYLFERWKNHMARTESEDLRRVIKTHQLNRPSTRFFFEVRPRNLGVTTPQFLALLWVTQEILKLVPSNPPWPNLAGQLGVQDLTRDSKRLQLETSRNTSLILRHSRLVLGEPQLSTERATERGIQKILRKVRK